MILNKFSYRFYQLQNNTESQLNFKLKKHLYCCSLFTHTMFLVQIQFISQYTCFPGDSDSNESACRAGDLGSIPGSGRSPGEGNGYPLYYSCLENSLDRGAWQAMVHGVANSQTRLKQLNTAHSTLFSSWQLYYNSRIIAYFEISVCFLNFKCVVLIDTVSKKLFL